VFGGLAVKLPVYAGLMSLTCFASLGLPGLSGFISEFMCFLGAFQAWKWQTTISVLGIIATAAFFLRMMQKVFLGPVNEKWSDLTDMTPTELACVIPLVIIMVWFGVSPKWPLDLMNTTVISLLSK
jgi:NADH-quinone oxidoreductase subunit M